MIFARRMAYAYHCQLIDGSQGETARGAASRTYTSLNPRPPLEPPQPGSNGSSDDDFVDDFRSDVDFSELHSDMKWDLGIGLRAMIQKGVFRADLAGSTEGFRFIVMVGHPF